MKLTMIFVLTNFSILYLGGTTCVLFISLHSIDRRFSTNKVVEGLLQFHVSKLKFKFTA